MIYAEIIYLLEIDIREFFKIIKITTYKTKAFFVNAASDFRRIENFTKVGSTTTYSHTIKLSRDV